MIRRNTCNIQYVVLLLAWVEVLVNEGEDGEKQRDLLEMDTDAPAKQAHKLGGEPKFKVRHPYKTSACNCMKQIYAIGESLITFCDRNPCHQPF